jgi:hypothetical protein
LARGRVSGHYPYPSPELGVIDIIKMLCAAMRTALNTSSILVHLKYPFYFLYLPPLSGESSRNKGRLFIASGCGSMRIVVDWFRGNYDNYFKIYEVEDEEF